MKLKIMERLISVLLAPLITVALGLFILLLVAAFGCNQETTQQSEKDTAIAMLPSGARNVMHQGNYWYTFEMGSNKYLANTRYHNGAITQVID